VIESVGGLDVYAFEARPGQRVYFHTVKISAAVAGARWVLSDADGMAIFDTCLGCTAPGVQHLFRGGRYTLTVGANGTGTGFYELRLFDVPPPERFALTIGATVQDDEPARGAGAIQSPGAEDIFTFTAEPRERLYFRMLEHSPSAAGLFWRLTDADGAEVFNTCLGCSEPGVQRLSKGGEYTLTVGSSTNVGTGSYRLRLTRVPAPQRFAVKLPARIGSAAPAAGAGTIEVPGAEDVYVFDADPGQRVRFRSLERDRAVDGIKWRLVDRNGNQVFDSCLGCTDPGEQRLTAGGSYELIVGHTGSAATGAYSIAAEPAN
jgi:cytochrome c2